MEEAIALKTGDNDSGAVAPLPATHAWQAPISNDEFDLIREIARARAGIVIADFKRNMVFRRISARLRALNLVKVADYCAILTGPQRDFCRSWPNQVEVTVKGIHFIQEDSPNEIGQTIADWLG